MRVYIKKLKHCHHSAIIEKTQEVSIVQRRYEISDEKWGRIKKYFLEIILNFMICPIFITMIYYTTLFFIISIESIINKN